ncbi:toll/interleukin-1 receptor domain-containing protein [Proteiniphilum sp.]|uniref:toll/interleukin-1 receptor domain-containing protein n=1 Tax=Proteiniphilum sp. TaxID=1926877 RepID=UPI00331FC2C5
MNSSYYQNQITRIEKEIADLNKKVADEFKKELSKNKQIDSVSRSITKNTSISMLTSKQRQIDGYRKEILACKTKIADYQKNIVTKNSELGRKRQELLKAQQTERKKIEEDQLKFQKKLQRDIELQKSQLNILAVQSHSSLNQVTESDDLEGRTPRYDFFISHASEDKNDIVRELAEALIKNGFKVWYDEFELKIGDSLRKNIDRGLSNSNYGIVIISPSFVKKNWTEYELNGMVAREMNGHKVILPIWHKITKNEVLEFSPSLADKYALNTSIHTIEEIVENLKSFKQ